MAPIRGHFVNPTVEVTRTPPHARPAASSGVPRSLPRTLQAVVSPRHPTTPNQAESPGAKFRGAGGVNDCGPPRWTGSEERSVPSEGGPQCCLSKALRVGGCADAASRGTAKASRASGVCRRAKGTPPSRPSVLGRNRDGQLPTSLFPPSRKHSPTPTVGHSSPKPVAVDPALIARAIGRFHVLLTPPVGRTSYP